MVLDELLDVLVLNNIDKIFINDVVTRIHTLTPTQLSSTVKSLKLKTVFKSLTSEDINYDITYFNEADIVDIADIILQIPEQSIYASLSAHIELEERR